MLCLVKDGEILVFLLLLLVSISFLLFSFYWLARVPKVIEKEDEKIRMGSYFTIGIHIFFSYYYLYVICDCLICYYTLFRNIYIFIYNSLFQKVICIGCCSSSGFKYGRICMLVFCVGHW